MNRLHQDYAARGLDIIAISDEQEGLLKRYIEQNQVRYPVFRDASSQAARTYGVRGIPMMFLLSDEDRILWQGHGFGDEMMSLLEEHLTG